MERVLLARHAAGRPFGSLSGSDIGLKPDDWQHLGHLGLAQKLDGTVQVAMIRQSERGHPQRLGALE